MSKLNDIEATSKTDIGQVKKELEKVLIKTVIAARISGQKQALQAHATTEINENKQVLEAVLDHAIDEAARSLSGQAANRIVNKAEKLATHIPILDMGTSL